LTKYRIKEYPRNVFSIEEKCWFLWLPIIEHNFKGWPIIATYKTHLNASFALERYKNNKKFKPRYDYQK